MSIFTIPKTEIEAIRPLLQKNAEKLMDMEGVCTLAEVDSDGAFAGCIQYSIEELEGGKDRAGRLLYLYVLPERRNKGVGEQLLMAMEEALSKRQIEKAQVLLSQEQSELGEYLENYGFPMRFSRRFCFIRLSSIRMEKRFKEELFDHICSLNELPNITVRKIYGKYQDMSTWNLDEVDPDVSCAMTLEDREALLIVREESGQWAISFAAPAGEAGSEMKAALFSWMAGKMKKKYPVATKLMLCDTRDMTWYVLYAGHQKDGTEAIEGVLLVEEPERRTEKEEETEEELREEELWDEETLLGIGKEKGEEHE